MSKLLFACEASEPAVTVDDVGAAQNRIRGLIHRTPVLTSATLDERCSSRLYFKCENFQRSGSFKARGAFNAVFSLPDEGNRRSVVTSSSGNQAAALSLAARRRGFSAYVAMPRSALRPKVAAVQRYGGQIRWVEAKGSVPTPEEYERAVAEIVEQTGALLVHPYNDLRTIAGQGTCALELLEQVPDLDALMVPVGGGGLIAGIALTAKFLRPRIRVIGCEPAAVDDAQESLRSGKIAAQRSSTTIADGLRTSLGSLTFPLIQRFVDDIVTVSEGSIIEARQLIADVLKVVIEPSSAVPVAALLGGATRGLAHVGVVLTGGNV